MVTMGLSYTWENEAKTVLRFSAAGEWTWIEYDNFIDQLLQEVKAQDHIVHIILISAEQFPPGSPLPHLRRVSKLMPDNVGKIIVTGGSMFIRSINTALSKVLPKTGKQLMFAADINEARAMLRKIGVAEY
jgi:hypothetical protein